MSFFITLIEATDASRRDLEAQPKIHGMIHSAVKSDIPAHEASGSEVLLTTPAEFAQLQARDTAMWARVVRAAGMIPE